MVTKCLPWVKDLGARFRIISYLSLASSFLLPPPLSPEKGRLTLQLTQKHPTLTNIKHIKHMLPNINRDSLMINGFDDVIFVPGVERVAEAGVDCWHQNDVCDAVVDDGL